MLGISVGQDAMTSNEMANTLEYIANQIRQGYTSSVDPAWSLSGEEEDPEDWS